MPTKGEQISPENRTALECGDRVKSIRTLLRWLAKRDRQPSTEEKLRLVMWRGELAYLRKFGWSPEWRSDMERNDGSEP